MKHYERDADGYDVIVEAAAIMTNIAHHINDMKRRHEHAVRVQEIQSLLYGWQVKIPHEFSYPLEVQQKESCLLLMLIMSNIQPIQPKPACK